MQEKITSLQNSRIKFLSSLQEKSRIRKKERKFLVEGLREISLCRWSPDGMVPYSGPCDQYANFLLSQT